MSVFFVFSFNGGFYLEIHKEGPSNRCNLSPISHFIMQIWKRNNQQWLDFNENGLNIAPEFHVYLCPPV